MGKSSPCAETKLDLRKNMRPTRVLVAALIVQTCFAAMAYAQSATVIGSWNIEIAFADGSKRSLRLDAQDAGKGTLMVVDPRLKVWGPGKPVEARRPKLRDLFRAGRIHARQCRTRRGNVDVQRKIRKCGLDHRRRRLRSACRGQTNGARHV